jgi:hypothetical protein
MEALSYNVHVTSKAVHDASFGYVTIGVSHMSVEYPEDSDVNDINTDPYGVGMARVRDALQAMHVHQGGMSNHEYGIVVKMGRRLLQLDRASAPSFMLNQPRYAIEYQDDTYKEIKCYVLHGTMRRTWKSFASAQRFLDRMVQQQPSIANSHRVVVL